MTIRNYNTGFKNTLQTDLRQGLGAEKARQSGFEEYFGRLSKTAKYDSFDFTNDSFYVEHKERNIPFGKYDSLFFDAIKFHEFQRLKTLEPHKRFVIIWTCLGKSFFWEFQENDEDDQGNINPYPISDRFIIASFVFYTRYIIYVLSQVFYQSLTM